MAESVPFASKAVIDDVLGELRRVPGVKGVCIVRRDGGLLGAKLATGADPVRMGRMVAAVVGTSEMVALELDYGDFYQTIIDCVDGRILGHEAPGGALVVALLEPGANLGLVMLSVRRAASKLEPHAAVAPVIQLAT